MTKSLGGRLFRVVIVTAAVTFMASSVWLSLSVQQQSLQDAQRLASTLSQSYQHKIEAEFAASYSAAESLANAVQAIHATKADRAQAIAVNRQILASNPQFVGLGNYWEPDAFDGQDAQWVKQPGHDETGRFVPYWNRAAGELKLEPVSGYQTENADNQWYYLPKRTLQPWATEPYSFEIAGKPVLMVSLMVPIIEQGRFLGSVGADYPLQGLSDRLNTEHPFGEGYLALLSTEGVYATHPQATQVNRPAQDLPAEALAALKQGRAFEGALNAQWQLHLVPIQVGKAPNAWGLLVAYPLAPIEQHSQQLVWWTWGISLAGLLAMALISWPLLRRVLKPLSNLAEQLSNWSGELQLKSVPDGQDETGRIGRAFQGFLSRLQQMVQSMQQSGRALDQTTDTLQQEMQQVAQRSHQQLQAAQSVGHDIESLSQAGSEMLSDAQAAQQLAVQTGQLTAQIVKLVFDTVADIEQTAQTMTQVSAAVGQLDNRSHEIAGILNVIKEIADQTNLLALNAAIEAARAGEQGRGFAVVADEVRSLAARTAQSTGQIANMIAAINADTRQAVEGVESAVGSIQTGIDKTRQSAGQIEQIRHFADSIAANSAGIVRHAQQQSSQGQQVLQRIEQIRQQAQDNDQAISGALQELRVLGEQAASLTEQVRQFR